MTPEPRRAADLASHAGANPPKIPDYDLLRRIGQGGYGEVWLGRGLTGAYRAVKIVWRDRFEDAEPFHREFRGVKESMAGAPDVGQLALLHVGQNEAAGFFYYVMELADDATHGRAIDPAGYVPLTLKELKAKRGRLPAAECIDFAVELARALHGLHARGLVHRDIKPSNIILVNGAPKLADVGLVAASTDARTFVGTQGYMPPEGPGTPGADVFALGRVIYELATGFERDEFPRLPAEMNDAADRKALFELNEILLRACEPLSEKRYRDAEALLQDLLALQGGRSLRQRRMRGALLRGGAVLAIVALAGGAAWWRWRRPATEGVAPSAAPIAPTTPVVHPNSIAMLPFENLSVDRENGYFAEGISEDILTDLANINSLRVIARTTMQQYRQTTKPIRQIATELGVAYVFEGSVRRAGNRVRVTGQLIRAASEQPVWAKTYDRDLTDVFALQSELSHDIVAAVQGVLTPMDESRLAARSTTNLAAYDLYQQARALGENPIVADGVPEKQLALLQRAVELDPNYSDAWVLLSRVHLGMGTKAFQATDPAAVAQARADLDHAERLAPDNYNVLTQQANLAAFRGDRVTVNHYRQRVVELFPGRAEAWLAVGLTAGHDGRYQDQIAAYRKALVIDPRNAEILWQLKETLGSHRRYDEYAEVLQRLRAVQPNARSLEFEQAVIPLHQHGSTAELQALLARLPAHPDATDVELIVIRSQIYFILGDAAGFVRFWREMGPAWRFHESRVLDEVVLAMALRAAHDPTDIRPLLEKARDRAHAVLQREPRNGPRWNQYGLALAMLGDQTEARAALARVRELAREANAEERSNFDSGVIFYNAVWRGWAGEVREAIPQLDGPLKGPVANQHSFVHEMRISFLMLPFQGNPAFEALLNDPANNAPLSDNGTPELPTDQHASTAPK